MTTRSKIIKMARALNSPGVTLPVKAKVFEFSGITKLDLNPDRTLRAQIGKLQGFVIAGYDKEGNEFFASTYADGGNALWLLERCKTELLRQTY